MARDISIRLLGPGDEALLEAAHEDVFDHKVVPALARAFLADPRHHIVAAIDDGLIIGSATGVDYFHPDKAPELFVNEVAVAAGHQRRGIARELLRALLGHARTLGCVGAWVGTELDNDAANALYEVTSGKRDAPFNLYYYDLGAPELSS